MSALIAATAAGPLLPGAPARAREIIEEFPVKFESLWLPHHGQGVRRRWRVFPRSSNSLVERPSRLIGKHFANNMVVVTKLDHDRDLFDQTPGPAGGVCRQ